MTRDERFTLPITRMRDATVATMTGRDRGNAPDRNDGQANVCSLVSP